MNKPVIKFQGYKINTIKYTKANKEISKEKQEAPLSVETSISKDLKEAYVELKIVLHKNDINLYLEVIGEFGLEGDLSLEEYKNFLAVNGTAIVYPYVRSIVSVISTLDSKDAIILPTINTMNFAIEND